MKMDIDQMKLDLDTLESMPEEEVKYVSTASPEKTAFDLAVYRKGPELWGKLKSFRKILGANK